CRIRFHDLAFAAHWAKANRSHRLTQTVRHEPSCFQRHAKRAVKLIRADTLLAGAHEERRLEPQAKLYVAILKDSANAHGELALAVVAFPKAVNELAFGVLLAGLRALVFELAETVYCAAMRAYGTVRPHDRFKGFEGFRFVVKPGIGEGAFHA